jgi:hypothetical protein
VENFFASGGIPPAGINLTDFNEEEENEEEDF